MGELSDGAHKLADGITEFSEEGIDEIINSYNGDIEPLVDRIQAVLDAVLITRLIPILQMA